MSKVIHFHDNRPRASLAAECASHLTEGSLFIHPTETFYGIGALYDDEPALEKLFAIKQREADKPALLLISSADCLRTYASAVPETAFKIAERFWPGPVTILLPAAQGLSQYLCGPQRTAAFRVTSHPLAAALAQELKKPFTSTSANISGGAPPANVTHIPYQIRDAVDLIIDSGDTPGGRPSTIIDLCAAPYRIVRDGAIAPEEIRKCLGK